MLISRPTPSALQAEFGNAKASLGLKIDLSSGTVGFKLQVDGGWLSKQSENFSVTQKQMLNVVLGALGGREAIDPGSVKRDAQGGQFNLARPAFGGSTVTYQRDVSFPSVLSFLGLSDRKGTSLFSLGRQRPQAPVQAPPTPQQRNQARAARFAYQSANLGTANRTFNPAPNLPPRPVAPPLPPRPGSSTEASSQPAQPSFAQRSRANSFPGMSHEGYMPDANEALAAEQSANRPSPPPSAAARLSRAEFEAKINGWSIPRDSANVRPNPPAPPSDPGVAEGSKSSSEPPSPRTTQANETAPPKPPKIPVRGEKSASRPQRPRSASEPPSVPPKEPELGIEPPPIPPKEAKTGNDAPPGPSGKPKTEDGVPPTNGGQKAKAEGVNPVEETAAKPAVKELYERLGLSSTATEIEVKKAFRKKAIVAHPDKNIGKPEAVEEYQHIQMAYDILSNPKARSDYDAGLIGETGQDKYGRLFTSKEQPFDPEPKPSNEKQ
jgi:hypothetical protein